MGASEEHVRKFLELLRTPDSIVELRVLNTKRGIVSGYFDDLTKMVQEAMRWNGKASVYATLNPVNPALLARSRNRLSEFARHTTSDADILDRRWLPIDLDPLRPAGISATAVQHQLALERAQQVRQWLKDRSWPDPIVADSGNGAHLLCRIDLPNDDESKNLIGQCLKALDFRYSDDLVKIDCSTFNASRIWKVYGTMACKGDSTPDRPHRLAKLLEVLDELR